MVLAVLRRVGVRAHCRAGGVGLPIGEGGCGKWWMVVGRTAQRSQTLLLLLLLLLLLSRRRRW